MTDSQITQSLYGDFIML